jgi:hypothetical protein
LQLPLTSIVSPTINRFAEARIMKKVFLIARIGVIILSCILSPSIYAYDEERAVANLASDFAQCSAYYVIAAEGIRRTGDEKNVTKLMEASQRAYDYAVKFSNQKVTEARIQLAFDEQRKEMDHNYSNFSILILKYGNICKEALESPERRLQYWLSKKD